MLWSFPPLPTLRTGWRPVFPRARFMASRTWSRTSTPMWPVCHRRTGAGPCATWSRPSTRSSWAECETPVWWCWARPTPPRWAWVSVPHRCLEGRPRIRSIRPVVLVGPVAAQRVPWPPGCCRQLMPLTVAGRSGSLQVTAGCSGSSPPGVGFHLAMTPPRASMASVRATLSPIACVTRHCYSMSPTVLPLDLHPISPPFRLPSAVSSAP